MKKLFLAICAILLAFTSFSQTASALIDSAQAYNDSYIYNNQGQRVTPQKVHDAIDKVIAVLVHFDENWTPNVKDRVQAGEGIIIDSLESHLFQIGIDTSKFHSSAYNNDQLNTLLGERWSTTGENSAASEFNVTSGPYTFKSGGVPMIFVGGFNGSNPYQISVGYNSYAAGIRSIAIGRSTQVTGDSSILLGADEFVTAKRTLYIANYINKFHLRLDSAAGTAPNVIARNSNGDWAVYALPSGGGSDDLDDVAARGANTTHPISVTGNDKTISVDAATGFGQAGIGTASGKGYIWIAKSDGTYVQISPDSLISSQTLYPPNESGVIAVKKYKTYEARLYLTGTDAPVVTTLLNELGGTVTWAYSTTGEYTASCSGCFTSNKTILQFSGSNEFLVLTKDILSTSSIKLKTNDPSNFGISTDYEGYVDVSAHVYY